MRALFIAIVTFSLTAAGQGFAQQAHSGHLPAPASAVTTKNPANPTHEECKSVMGRKMDGHVLHDHSAEKGAPRPQMRHPLSKAAMDKMHGKCATKMAEPKK
ncbi:hypothetical protein [Phenylobacterium ferrooxidans]|uniref:Uncharacterized protein n=1 Tax=Phenylobacterium ferrooxidans TaxID=2982689 RepID=A0ABW6CQ51_9CAUL